MQKLDSLERMSRGERRESAKHVLSRPLDALWRKAIQEM